MNFTPFLCNGLAGFAALAMVSTAHAKEPRYRPVAIEAQFKGPDSERIERLQPQLETRASEILQLKGVGVDSSSTTTVVFHVLNTTETPDPGAAVSNYGTHIEVYIDGELVGEEITLCTRKGEAELIECALSGLPKLMHLLPQDEAPATEPKVITPADTDSDRVVAAPLGPLGIVGIVAAVAGVGLGIAGGIELSRGRVESEAEDLRSVDRIDHSQAGVGFAVAGGIALVAGVALIAVGVTKTKKKQRERSTRMQLDAAPGFAGLRLTGRF